MNSFLLEKTVPLKLLMVEGRELVINNYELSFTMLTTVEDVSEDAYADAQLKQNASYCKIITLLTDYVDNSIVYGIYDSDTVTSCFSLFGNNRISLPEQTEHNLIATLHSKLNAITDVCTKIDRVTIKDLSQDLKYEYVILEEGYADLPCEEEWEDDLSYWPGCWWKRNDITMMDRVAVSQEEYDTWLSQQAEHPNQMTEILNMIDREFEFSTCESSGAVIEVDFEESNVAEGKHVWHPILVD